MRLVGRDIYKNTYIGEDRREYTLDELAKIGIHNPMAHMIPYKRK